MATLTASVPETTRAIQGLLAGYATDAVRAALLNLPSGQQATSFDSTNDELTLTAAQTGWNTGDRVQLTIIGFLPYNIAPLATNTDYWLIKVSDTVFKLADSRANAIAGTALNTPTNADSTQYAVAIQAPNSTWPIADVVACELSHPGYTARLDFPGAVPTPTTDLTSSTITVTLGSIQHTDAADMVYNGMAIIDGPATPADATGTLINAGYMMDGTAIEVTTITNGESARDVRLSYKATLQ